VYFRRTYEWDIFLGQLRELQAQEAFARLELSTIVEQLNHCLSRLNRILLEKAQLVRNQPVAHIRTQPSVSPSVQASIVSFHETLRNNNMEKSQVCLLSRALVPNAPG
jgi:hypothetical protein